MAIAIVLSSVFTASCPTPGTYDYGYTPLLPSECCNWYFSCSNGVPIPMQCPDGLFFNDELDVCDWIQSVDCGEKPLYCSAYPGDSGSGYGDCPGQQKLRPLTVSHTTPDQQRLCAPPGAKSHPEQGWLCMQKFPHATEKYCCIP